MKRTEGTGSAPSSKRRSAERPVRPDDGNAFLPDNTGTHQPFASTDAESVAEEFVATALGGESVEEDARDEVSDQEEGGPFLVLGEDGQLPPEPEARAETGADDAEAQSPQTPRRGARWAARGI